MNELPNDELLSAYLDGELSAADRAAVERHLAESPDSRQLLDELRAIGAGVRALPRHRLDADFGQRVLRRAERQMLVDPAPPAAQPAGSPFATEEGRPRLASAPPAANGAPHDRRRLWRMVVWPCAALATAAALLIAVDPLGFRQAGVHRIAGVNFDHAADMPAPAAATPTEAQDFDRLIRRQAPRSGGADRAFDADGAEYFAKSQSGAAQAPGGMGGGGMGGAAGAYGNAAMNEPVLLVMLDVREGADPQKAISHLFAEANIQLTDEAGLETTLGRSSSGGHRFAKSLTEDEMERGESAPGESVARDNRASDFREANPAAGEGLGDESGSDNEGDSDAASDSVEAVENRPADKLVESLDTRAKDQVAMAEEFYFEVEATPDQLQALIRDAQSQPTWFVASALSLTGSGPADAAFGSYDTVHLDAAHPDATHLGAMPAGGQAAGGRLAGEPTAGAGASAAPSGAIEPAPSPPLPAPPLSTSSPDADAPVPPPAPIEEARSAIPKGETRPSPDAPERPSPSKRKAPRSDPAPRSSDGEESDSGRSDRSRRTSIDDGGAEVKKAEKPIAKRLSGKKSDNIPSDDRPAEDTATQRGARLHDEVKQQSSDVADHKQNSIPMGGARRLAELPESLRGRAMYRAPTTRKEAAGAPPAAELHDSAPTTESFNFIDALPVREDLKHGAAGIVSGTAKSDATVPPNAVPPAAVPFGADAPNAEPPSAMPPNEVPPGPVDLQLGEGAIVAEVANEQAPSAPATVRAIIVVRVPPPPVTAESRDESKASPADPVEPAGPAEP